MKQPKKAGDDFELLAIWGMILSAITAICLAPFADKAFHIDDPLFLWAARQIQDKPLDFYGFHVNWYSEKMPMSEVTKNPPLASYYIALVTAIAGWEEVALHIGFMIPACACALGVFFLARRMCSRPEIAALATILTPAFLVSASNVMCDVMMLAFWLWALIFWIRGFEKGQRADFITAGLLIGACALTKYFGMSLIILAFIYGVIKQKRIGWWAAYLLIPVVILATYQIYTTHIYGRGLLTDAAVYATEANKHTFDWFIGKGLVGFAFIGGSVASVLFFLPFLWPRIGLLAAAVGAAALTALLPGISPLAGLALEEAGKTLWVPVLHLAVMAVAGIGILALIADDLADRLDADSALLALWILGTIVFACFINWSVNVRSVLPMAPAAGILIARRLERKDSGSGLHINRDLVSALVPMAVLALIVCWADWRLAGSARDAAQRIASSYSIPGQVLWHQGHWGFQYYMEKNGAVAFDRTKTRPRKGEFMAIPANNTNLFQPPINSITLIDRFEMEIPSWIATMNKNVGAGFYSDVWGPLPFAFGKVEQERYYVIRINSWPRKPVE